MLFKYDMNGFDHFGDDGLMTSVFFGLSYLFVFAASIGAFIFGTSVLR